MLIFGLGGRTLMNNNYFAPFGGGNNDIRPMRKWLCLAR